MIYSRDDKQANAPKILGHAYTMYFLTCHVIVQHEQNLFIYKTMAFMVTESILRTRCLFIYWTIFILNTVLSCNEYSAS